VTRPTSGGPYAASAAALDRAVPTRRAERGAAHGGDAASASRARSENTIESAAKATPETAAATSPRSAVAAGAASRSARPRPASASAALATRPRSGGRRERQAPHARVSATGVTVEKSVARSTLVPENASTRPAEATALSAPPAHVAGPSRSTRRPRARATPRKRSSASAEAAPRNATSEGAGSAAARTVTPTKLHEMTAKATKR
jgi:hypothetical protein